MDTLLQGLTWLGHASFRWVTSEATIYFDPWQLTGGPEADLILVSHSHHDHLSVADIDRISGPNTRILCPQESVAELGSRNATVVGAGQQIEVAGVAVQVVPAYNTDKPNHPHSAGHVGYIVEADGRRLYHAGDTDVIPEMSSFSCDIALLPMGGRYTMDAEQAAQAAGIIRPQVVVPMHWGRLVGTDRDVERMRALMPAGVELVVLQPEA